MKGHSVLSALVLYLCTGVAQAVPVTFTTTGSPIETYFQSRDDISATIQFTGRAATLDLTRDVAVRGNIFALYAGTGAADPNGQTADHRSFRLAMTVQGITQYLEFDLGVHEIANGQYQIDAFDMPILSFDLGATGMLMVTPDARYTQAVQLRANTAAYRLRDIGATFELRAPPTQSVPEPGTLALAALALGALRAIRRPGAGRCARNIR